MTTLGEFKVGAKVSPVFGDGVFKVEARFADEGVPKVVLREVMTRAMVTAPASSMEWVAWEEPRPVHETDGEGSEVDSTAGWLESQRLADLGVTVSVNGGEPASTAAGIHEEITKLARTALAEDADPVSGEIREPRRRAKPEQAALSGMPPRKPGIWPDVVVLGRAERVYSVVMSFGGSLDLKSSNPEDVWLAEQLLLGNPVTLEVAVVTDRTAHQLVKGQVVGAARVGVFDAAQAGETGYLRLQGENRRLREGFETVEARADAFSRELGDWLRKQGGKVPKELEEAHWGLREAIAGARP